MIIIGNFMSKRDFLFDLPLYHALDYFSGNITADVEMTHFSNLHIPYLPANHM